jgi:hypothetical protein
MLFSLIKGVDLLGTPKIWGMGMPNKWFLITLVLISDLLVALEIGGIRLDKYNSSKIGISYKNKF